MKCRINIILVAILLSKAIFGSILEVKIQDKQIAFIPDFEDHLKIVGYIADISTDGVFINVRQQKECLSKYVYVDNNNQIYLVRNYQYKAQGKLLNVFFAR